MKFDCMFMTGLVAAIVSGCAADPIENGDTDVAAYGSDWCELDNRYGDGVCDRFCNRLDTDCPKLGPDPAGVSTQYPIILHHGFAGGHAWIFAYNGIAEALRADGHAVFVTEVPPFDSIAVRAGYLQRAVDAALQTSGAKKVNIIAHSAGGLDARYLISSLGYGDRVASLTMMSTPNRGTAMADFGLKVVPGYADSAVDALARIIGVAINEVGQSANVRAALTDLAEANSPGFNNVNPDDPRVHYESWAGVSSLFGTGIDRDGRVDDACESRFTLLPDTFDSVRLEFVPLMPIVGHGFVAANPHDGIVTVASAKWGLFRGCIPADHSDEVGQMTTARPNPLTSFDPQRFWRQVAFDLAAGGF